MRVGDVSGTIVPKSPCIQVCTIGHDDLCKGCFRTLNEIANWKSLSNEDKQKILDRISDIGYNSHVIL